jgi:PleD family two-component response regulator
MYRPGEDAASLLKRADEALYQAKKDSRGTVVAADA